MTKRDRAMWRGIGRGLRERAGDLIGGALLVILIIILAFV